MDAFFGVLCILRCFLKFDVDTVGETANTKINTNDGIADTKINTNDKTDKLEDAVHNRPKTYAEILVNDRNEKGYRLITNHPFSFFLR